MAVKLSKRARVSKRLTSILARTSDGKMFAVSASPVAPLRGGARPTRRARRTSARAFFTKERAKPVATKTSKKLSQDESMKEMSSIVAQAFGLGISLPVGVVGLMEASKSVAPDQDVGLYGFLALALGCAAWWGAKSAARDKLKAELEAKGLDMSTVDNIGVLKWVKQQDDLGKGKQAVREIYKAYETESNPWSPFFKPTGVGKGGPKK